MKKEEAGKEDKPEQEVKTAEQLYQDLRIRGLLESKDAVDKRLIIESFESFAASGLISGEGKEAVGFADWISKESYISTTLPAEKVQLWQKNTYDREADKFTEGQEITSQELYQLYLESKKG